MKQLMVMGAVVLALGVVPVAAQERRSADEWCRESGWNDERARAFASAGFERVRNRFSVARMVADTLAVYEAITAVE